MSVGTEISRLENAKAAITTAIAGKGVTVPNGTKLDGMAALIDSIGSVSAVNNKSPDESGNVALTAADIPTSDNKSVEVALGEKPTKPVSSTVGDFAALDANGDLTDSGKKATDFAAANHNHAGTYAPVSHNHSAGDIVSGTMAIARGGTGQTTLTPAIGIKAARSIYAGTGGMTAGTTALTTGMIYLQYE